MRASAGPWTPLLRHFYSWPRFSSNPSEPAGISLIRCKMSRCYKISQLNISSQHPKSLATLMLSVSSTIGLPYITGHSGSEPLRDPNRHVSKVRFLWFLLYFSVCLDEVIGRSRWAFDICRSARVVMDGLFHFVRMRFTLSCRGIGTACLLHGPSWEQPSAEYHEIRVNNIGQNTS